MRKMKLLLVICCCVTLSACFTAKHVHTVYVPDPVIIETPVAVETPIYYTPPNSSVTTTTVYNGGYAAPYRGPETEVEYYDREVIVNRTRNSSQSVIIDGDTTILNNNGKRLIVNDGW